MKQPTKQLVTRLFVVVLFFTIAGCQDELDNINNPKDTPVVTGTDRVPVINRVSLDNAGQVFSQLKTHYGLDSHIIQRTEGLLYRAGASSQTGTIVVYTDVINKISADNSPPIRCILL